LARHPWPGNIRQLRNLIERLVVTVRATSLDATHAPPVTAEALAVGGASAGNAGQSLFTVEAGMSLAQVEMRLIRETLTRVTPHRAEAARLLGLSPRGLAYKNKARGLIGRTP